MKHVSLRQHLTAEVARYRRKLRDGLRMRHSRTWDKDVRSVDVDDWYDLPTSPRSRFHDRLRTTVRKLRQARAHLAEFETLTRRIP